MKLHSLKPIKLMKRELNEEIKAAVKSLDHIQEPTQMLAHQLNTQPKGDAQALQSCGCIQALDFPLKGLKGSWACH